MTDPTPAHLFPLYSPALACEALSCKWRGYAITACKAQGCGTRWAREAAEDKARRDEKDGIVAKSTKRFMAIHRLQPIDLTGPSGDLSLGVYSDPDVSLEMENYKLLLLQGNMR